MKRFKLFTLLLLVIVALLALGACKKALPTPQNVDLNVDNLQLSWNAVGGATRYVIRITNVDTEEIISKNTRATKYSIDGLLPEGDYDISVMAQAGDAFKESDWSEPIAYHQDYVSGAVYQLINNNSEYQIRRANATKGDVLIESVYRTKPVTTIAASAFRGNNNITSVTLGENIRVINENAFYNCTNLKKITFLSDEITSIGTSAFHACRGLEEINLPKTMTTIPDYLFNSCRELKSIEIPDGVVSIGVSAFDGCKALTSVTIPDSVLTIGEYAFSSCDKLATVNVGKNVEQIGANAFRLCFNLTSITFPADSNLRSIGANAFTDCYDFVEATETTSAQEVGLTSITLPAKLETIGNEAFYGCALLENIVIPESVSLIGFNAFVGTKDYQEQLEGEPSLIYIDKWLVDVHSNFSETNPGLKERLTDLVVSTGDEGETDSGKVMRKIKAGTIGIANRAFRAAPNLANVYLPESLKYVGNNVFAQCASLTKIVAEGENLISIGDWAFSYCKQLSNVQFQTGLKTIGVGTFKGCERLDNNTINPELLIPRTVEKIGTEAFADTLLWLSSSTVVYAGSWIVGFVEDSKLGEVDATEVGVTGISDYAFYGGDTLLGIKGLNSVRYIGYGAFYYCVSLGVISLNSNLKKIEDYTFYNCQSLSQVTFPSSLEEIGRAAFFKCSKLTTVDFSRCTNLKTIGINAFYNCANINTLEFGTKSALEEIGENAFYKCATGTTDRDSGIRSVKLPDSLKVLGPRAFMNCVLVSEVEIGSNLTFIGNHAFRGCDLLETLVIPGSVEEIGRYAFANLDNLATLKLEEGVKVIGENAFYESTSLYMVTLPDSLMNIQKYAFKGCRQLRTINLPAGIEEVGMHAFYGCKGLTIYSEAEKVGDNWHERWNSSYRPVIFNAILSEDNSYVVSVNMKLDGYVNIQSFNDAKIVLPERIGFVATGWGVEVPETLTAEGLIATITWTEGYSIKYILNGGMAEGGNPYQYYEGSPDIVLTGASKTQYILNPTTNTINTYVSEFLGWYNAETDEKVEVIASGSAGDLVLYAKWGEPTLVGGK